MANYKEEVIADSPVGYWRMNASTEVEDVINKNNAVAPEAVPTEPGVLPPEQSDLCNNFNKNSSPPYHFVVASGTKALELSENISVEAWVAPSQENHGSGIFEKTIGGTNNTSYLLYSEGYQVYFRVIIGTERYTASGPKGTGTPEFLGGSENIGWMWNHIVGVYNKTAETLTVYVNGVAGESVKVSGSVKTGAGASYIGCLGGLAYGFLGYIDEVAVYNKVLSSTRIKEHYEIVNSYKPPSGGKYQTLIEKTSGIMGYWRLNESNTSVAYDYIGKNHGTYGATGKWDKETKTGEYLLNQGALITGDSKASSVKLLGAAADVGEIAGGYVSVPSTPFRPTEELSVEAWIEMAAEEKPTEYGLQVILCNSEEAIGNYGYAVALSSPATTNGHGGEGWGRVEAWLLDGHTYGEGWPSVYTSEFIFKKEFKGHLVVTFVAGTFSGGGGKANIYVNGKKVSIVNAGREPSGPIKYQEMREPARIGSQGEYKIGHDAFNGRISEVAVYNKALTAAQALEHYEAGTIESVKLNSKIESKFLLSGTLNTAKRSNLETLYRKSEKEILGTVANVKYYHQAAEWDSPLSFGVQAFIEYNGLILNDRHQADLIRVTKISGLDDAEVRDNREPRPGESGEYAYDAFYGGRNLILSGFVEAGNLAALGTLSRNLKAAFAPLNESYLKFRWFDVYDPFDDPNTILEYNPNASLEKIPSGNYSPLIGMLSNLDVEEGLLSWDTPEKIAFLRTSDKRTFCDSQMTMKCIVGGKDSSYIGFILCVKNSENYLAAIYEENSGSPILKIISVIGNEEHKLVSKEITSSLRPVIGQPIWIRGRKEGNNIYCEFYNLIPTENFFPNFSVSCNLTGEDEELYGDEILSEVGIIGNQVNTNWYFDEFKIESIYPGDVQFKTRKINFSMADEQTSLTKFKRPFQITMKTSDFRAFSSAKLYKYIYPTSTISSPTLGRLYPRKYPLSYRIYTSSTFPSQSNLLSINNRGTVYVEPILYLYGPGENILIENLTNGQALEWSGIITEGDYIEIDCREKTIVNSVKSNYLEPLASSSEWIRIEPMWNDIYIQGYGFKEEVTKFVIRARHGYM